MSVQALKAYYDRVSAENPDSIAPYGFSEENIHFCIVISPKGKFLEYIDLTDKKGKKDNCNSLIENGGEKVGHGSGGMSPLRAA